MKKTLVAAVVMSVFVLGTVASASAAGWPVRANIPFSFYAGKVLLPAGEYIFEAGANLMVRKADGSDAYYVSIMNSGTTRAAGYVVTFSKYGDTYFLNKVQGEGFVVVSSKTPEEKRLAQLMSQPVTVAAARRK